MVMGTNAALYLARIMKKTINLLQKKNNTLSPVQESFFDHVRKNRDSKIKLFHDQKFSVAS